MVGSCKLHDVEVVTTGLGELTPKFSIFVSFKLGKVVPLGGVGRVGRSFFFLLVLSLLLQK